MNKEAVLLYVEDNESIREEMLEILKLKFENIYVASNGRDGLELYKKYNPDLVISDVQMPLMDGVKMSQEIRTLNPHAKIILTTAFNETEFISKAKTLGIQEYVSKPLNIIKLFESIEKYLSKDSK